MNRKSRWRRRSALIAMLALLALPPGLRAQAGANPSVPSSIPGPYLEGMERRISSNTGLVNDAEYLKMHPWLKRLLDKDPSLKQKIANDPHGFFNDVRAGRYDPTPSKSPDGANHQ